LDIYVIFNFTVMYNCDLSLGTNVHVVTNRTGSITKAEELKICCDTIKNKCLFIRMYF